MISMTTVVHAVRRGILLLALTLSPALWAADTQCPERLRAAVNPEDFPLMGKVFSALPGMAEAWISPMVLEGIAKGKEPVWQSTDPEWQEVAGQISLIMADYHAQGKTRAMAVNYANTAAALCKALKKDEMSRFTIWLRKPDMQESRQLADAYWTLQFVDMMQWKLPNSPQWAQFREEAKKTYQDIANRREGRTDKQLLALARRPVAWIDRLEKTGELKALTNTIFDMPALERDLKPFLLKMRKDLPKYEAAYQRFQERKQKEAEAKPAP